jgi:alanyl-tRNA synthetase
MTERLYYDDAYLTRFRARLLKHYPHKNGAVAVLDRTAFYPTSGGQPFDRGTLAGAQVVDVWVREEDDAVLHLLQTPPDQASGEVSGEVDWERRFDHMQQHSGQHVLSQAFVQVSDAETVSFHLGEESATIDLAAPSELAPAAMKEAEALANRILFEDRLVTARFVTPAELAQLPLRKPPAVSQDIRVVQVDGFDWSACGGTHVARTGEIGLIKVVKWERRGAETRVEFRCGWRALTDYAQKNRMVNQLAAGFNVGHWELDQAVERLTEEAKSTRSDLRQATRMLAGFRAEALRREAPVIAGVRLVTGNLTEEASLDLREVARRLVSEPGVVALLGAGEKKAQLCFARSVDIEIDMVPLVRSVSQQLGARGGGGSPDFAQGGGPLMDGGQLDAVLGWAAQEIRNRIERTE